MNLIRRSAPKLLLLSSGILALAFVWGDDAAAVSLNATYKEDTGHCEPPTKDCAIIHVPPEVASASITRFAPCDFIRSHSKSHLAQLGDQWVATDSCE